MPAGILISLFILILASSLFIINPTSSYELFTFMQINWFSDIFTLTDIQTLGYSVFLGNPLTVLIIGLLLWIVLVGILCICS
jgi:hypothetical protein